PESVEAVLEGAPKVNDIGLARRRDHKIVVPALARAVVVRRIVRIRAIRTRFKGELRRTVLHPIAPEKLTCIRDRAVRHRLSPPSRPVADVHTRMATLERNCELSAVRVLARHQWREDLRPTRTAVAGAPDALLEGRGVERVVTPIIRIELNMIDAASREVAVPNEAERRAPVR